MWNRNRRQRRGWNCSAAVVLLLRRRSRFPAQLWIAHMSDIWRASPIRCRPTSIMFSPSIISQVSSRHSQRGAIGLWGSMTLLLAVMFMALAVDTGRLWMQQRKLQSIADIASMEAARFIGCNADSGNVLSAAQAAAARNGYS